VNFFERESKEEDEMKTLNISRVKLTL